MKTAMATVYIVLLLSTLIWVSVYYVFPEAPLKPRETALVVFLCTVVTAATQFAWNRLRHRDRKDTHAAHK